MKSSIVKGGACNKKYEISFYNFLITYLFILDLNYRSYFSAFLKFTIIVIKNSNNSSNNNKHNNSSKRQY